MSDLLKSILLVALCLFSPQGIAANAPAIWDDRCEECHGDAEAFSVKYLWNIEGQLQGQHHVEDLERYLSNHYVPRYARDAIRDMLLAVANSPLRFDSECSGCHGDAAEFVAKSIWVRGKRVTALDSGLDIREFLPGHHDLQPEDISFFLKLFSRIAGKPFLDEEPLKEAITR